MLWVQLCCVFDWYNSLQIKRNIHLILFIPPFYSHLIFQIIGFNKINLCLYRGGKNRKARSGNFGLLIRATADNRKLKGNISFLMHLPVVCKTGGMSILLLSISCRWCGLIFFVCRSCWRGQAYCGDLCRLCGKRHNRREAQRRYRQTPQGKKSHREAENRRRHGWSEKYEKNMDDATTIGLASRCINRFMQVKHRIIYSFKSPRCHFCGSFGQVVDKFPRRGYG